MATAAAITSTSAGSVASQAAKHLPRRGDGRHEFPRLRGGVMETGPETKCGLRASAFTSARIGDGIALFASDE